MWQWENTLPDKYSSILYAFLRRKVLLISHLLPWMFVTWKSYEQSPGNSRKRFENLSKQTPNVKDMLATFKYLPVWWYMHTIGNIKYNMSSTNRNIIVLVVSFSTFCLFRSIHVHAVQWSFPWGQSHRYVRNKLFKVSYCCSPWIWSFLICWIFSLAEPSILVILDSSPNF